MFWIVIYSVYSWFISNIAAIVVNLHIENDNFILVVVGRTVIVEPDFLFAVGSQALNGMEYQFRAFIGHLLLDIKCFVHRVWNFQLPALARAINSSFITRHLHCDGIAVLQSEEVVISVIVAQDELGLHAEGRGSESSESDLFHHVS